jgi:hypothetical protein
MIPIFLAGNLPEAELLKERLRQSGIQAIIKNRELQGALGELPMTLLPEVCVVDDRDVERALEEVAALENSGRMAKEPDVRCASCGEDNPANFELCWKCRRDL